MFFKGYGVARERCRLARKIDFSDQELYDFVSMKRGLESYIRKSGPISWEDTGNSFFAVVGYAFGDLVSFVPFRSQISFVDRACQDRYSHFQLKRHSSFKN